MFKTLFSLVIVCLPELLFSQDFLRTNSDYYFTGDSIRVNFKCFEGLIHSNFGGCGSGVIFTAYCIDNPEFSKIQFECDHLLVEKSPIVEGEFFVVIDHPGSYKIIAPKFKSDEQQSLSNYNEKLESEVFKVR